MAARRWALDRERREKLAAANAERFPGNIVRRVIVIDDERVVREAVIFDFDSFRSASAKLRKVLARR